MNAPLEPESLEVSAGQAEHARLLRLATRAAVLVALVLIVAKAIAWVVTDSVAILSSLLDSVLDAGASLVNLVAVSHALTPADDEHRFGHGKAEALAGLAQSAFISGSAIFLLAESAQRLHDPRALTHDGVGLAVMVGSLVLTVGLVLLQRHVIRRTGSLAISADSVHYQSDVAASVGVIVAILLSTRLGWVHADALVALLVAIYILHGAWRIAGGSLDQLMDRELPAEQRDLIQRLALEHAQVLGMHDLRTRASGSQSFIQLHLELESTLSFVEAHGIGVAVQAAICEAFPTAEVIIHQDPVEGSPAAAETLAS